MADQYTRDRRSQASTRPARQAERDTGSESREAERYFHFEPYDNRSDDPDGFGYGHESGETARFGAGGMSPEPGRSEPGPDEADMGFGPGPDYRQTGHPDDDRRHWTDGYPPVGSSGWGPTVPDYDAPRDGAPLRSRWAEGRVAHAPSSPSPIDERDRSRREASRGRPGDRGARLEHTNDARAFERTPDPAGFGLSAAWAPGFSDSYLNWRQKQVDRLDADYVAYCEHCQNEFDSNFNTWRANRAGTAQKGDTPRANRKK